MAAQNCPGKPVLLEFAAGRGERSLRSTIQAHLDQCPLCRTTVAAAAETTTDQSPTHFEPLQMSGSYLPCDIVDIDSSEQCTRLTADEELNSRFDHRVLEPPREAGALGHLGKYIVLEVLGYGGMGVVFRAKDEQLLRMVAIKMMSRELASSPTARRRFIREARAAAAINHSNVVTIHAVEEHQGTPFLVMEFIQGESLRDRLRHRPKLEIGDVVSIAFQVASGLSAAHAQGVIHRDIKPGNVMLEDKLARVKITDFGLARVAVDNIDLTSNHIGIGTPAYMSPEQVKGDAIDHRTDLFALGCVIYAMLRGHSPFHGRSALEVARNVADREPSPPTAESGIPTFLSEIIERLLEKSPDKRYQSAAEVAELLRRDLDEINRTPTDRLNRLLHDPVSVPARNKRQMLALAAAAVLSVVALTGVVGWQLGLFGKRLEVHNGTASAGDEAADSSGPSQAGAASAGAEESSVAVVTPVSEPPRILAVARTGEADFTTLNAALAQAVPGSTIRILDSGEYQESLMIDDARKWRNVTIEGAGPSAPTISNPNEQRDVVRIENTPGVVLRNLNLRQVVERQHALRIRGSAAGVTLDRVWAQGDSGKYAVLYVRFGLGLADQPIVIRDSQIDSAYVGIYVDTERPTDPTRHLHVVGNRFHGRAANGPKPDAKAVTHILLKIDAQAVRIERNVFEGGTAVELQLPAANSSRDLTIANNTFFRNEKWLNLADTSPDLSGVVVANNLILESSTTTIPTDPVKGRPLSEFVQKWTFRGNHWELPAPLSDETLRSVAEIRDSIAVVSREAGHQHFLKLSAPLTPAATSDMDLPSYVGALPP